MVSGSEDLFAGVGQCTHTGFGGDEADVFCGVVAGLYDVDPEAEDFNAGLEAEVGIGVAGGGGRGVEFFDE